MGGAESSQALANKKRKCDRFCFGSPRYQPSRIPMASPLCSVETIEFAGVIEAKPASLLRELSRKSPRAGITSASHLEIRPAPETASSGIAEIDALTGGLPRGCLTEVSGADSSGRTSLMLSAIAAATRREETCALIDVSDAF